MPMPMLMPLAPADPAHAVGPDEVAVGIELGDEDVLRPDGGEIVDAACRDRSRPCPGSAGGVDAAVGGHGDGVGNVVAAAPPMPRAQTRLPEESNFDDKGVLAAGRGEVEAARARAGSWPCRRSCRRRRRRRRAHGDAVAGVVAGAAHVAGPDERSGGGILGHEDVAAAGAGEIVDARAGIEIDRAVERAGDVDVAGGVGGDRLAGVVARRRRRRTAKL